MNSTNVVLVIVFDTRSWLLFDTCDLSLYIYIHLFDDYCRYEPVMVVQFAKLISKMRQATCENRPNSLSMSNSDLFVTNHRVL